MTDPEFSLSSMPDLAISVRQPWAWALIEGHKDVENRNARAIRLGGYDRVLRVALHASQGMTQLEYKWGAEFMKEIGVICPPPHVLTRGAVIGSINMAGVSKSSRSPWFMPSHHGSTNPNRAILMTEPHKLISPIPCSGELGLFKWKPNGGSTSAILKWMLPRDLPIGERAPYQEPGLFDR